MATNPNKRKIPKGERTRRLIKDAVLGLYGQVGWEKTTLEDILKATGLTVGAFYFHFSSKDDLIEEIAIETFDGYHQAIVEEIEWDEDFFTVAYQVINYYYRGYIHNPVLTKMMYSSVMRKPKAYASWQENRKALREKIESCIINALADKDDQSVDPVFLSHFLLSSLEDFLYEVFIAKGNKDLSKLASGPDVFVRQQAILWYRAVLTATPTNTLARGK